MRFRAALPFLFVLLAGCPGEETRTKWIYSTDPHWPMRQLLPPGGHWFVTSDAYDDTLTFLDADTLALVARIPVGLSPAELEGLHHVVLSPDGQFLYTGVAENVPNSGTGPHGSHGDGSEPGYVLKIRLADARLVGSVRVDRNPGDLVLSPDGTTLWVSHFDVKRILDVVQAGGPEEDKNSAIATIDTETMTLRELVDVCPAEHGMTLSPDAETIYMACYGSDRLAVVDVSAPGLSHTLVPLGASPQVLPATLAYGPYAVTVDPDEETVWVSCWESEDIRAFDTVSGTIDPAREIDTPGSLPGFGGRTSQQVVFARQSSDPGFPDDRVVVVQSGGAPAFVEHVVDPGECTAAHQAIPDPTRAGKALVVCEGNHATPGTLVRIDLVTGAVEETAEVGIFPDAVVYVPSNGGLAQ